MRFEHCICCDERTLKVQMDVLHVKFLGNSEQILIKEKAELFIILRDGITKSGIYKSYDTEHDYLFLDDGEEIQAKQIIFVGVL